MKEERRLMRRPNDGVALPDGPTAEAVLLPISERERKNEYYLALSRRFIFLRYLTLAFLVIYILLMIMFCGEDITVANLKYLLRDINVSSTSGEAFSKVDYTAEPIQRFAVYRGELMYVTGGEVKLFSATGNTGLASSLSYESPTILTTDKYAMIYDLGGDGYSLYNSFSELHRGKTDGTIISASLSESGSFALLTSGKDHKSIIYLFSDDFALLTKYSKNEYITDIVLSPDGKKLAMSSVTAVSGDFVTKLTVYDRGIDTPSAEFTVAGEYPAALRETDTGFVLLGTEKIHFYGFDGVRVGVADTAGTVGMCDVMGKYTVLVCPENTLASKNRIIILDSSAAVVYDKVLDEKITDISVSEYGDAFILTSERAVMINIETSTEKATESLGAKRIVAIGDEAAVLCTSASAEAVDFSVLTNITN